MLGMTVVKLGLKPSFLTLSALLAGGGRLFSCSSTGNWTARKDRKCFR
ncbi:hypothetical protein [Candidatus Mycoplasma haematominutum]|uniref:Uncharacterized protein n=1 Tax=Candidatus Mycoplasma haematominutum 'Birmingham 1' TaxID=1116213 RepID=G8C3S3_9MOLU|nr:hypothetical protein [Candidatus Mycoplasma haematominutum]CCE66971.1 hypothetical protein MHM_04530 [Candidatus Mycoplasma haematominutum 'Birmingham 1']